MSEANFSIKAIPWLWGITYTPHFITVILYSRWSHLKYPVGNPRNDLFPTIQNKVDAGKISILQRLEASTANAQESFALFTA